MFDYTVIGSGIVGSLILRELSKYQLKILMLEKDNDIVGGQTIANSAIIHSGYDPKPGTLKARLCVEGNLLYDKLEKELKIPLLKTGAFVVASKEEEKDFNFLVEKTKKNNVKYEILTGKQVRLLEPLLSENIEKAISLPTTKVTYPWEVAIRSIENAINNGACLEKNSEVVNIVKENGIYNIYLKNGKVIKSKNVINAAGVNSGFIASLVEKEEVIKMLPRKGEYFVLDKKAIKLFSHVIYPIPTKISKGVLIVPQVHGNILLGPTAYDIKDKYDVSNTASGLNYIKENLKRLTDYNPYQMIIRTFSGIRASSNYGDFYIKESKSNKGFYNVAGIDSPGLTAAPAIAKYLVEEVIKIDAPLKKDFNPNLEERIVFHNLSKKEQEKLLKLKPKYGNLVCKCEKITEQEIIEAIKGPVGSDTIKGIKKRARAGSGLCQGGYCENTVLKIIAKQTGKKLTEVNYYAEDTPILVKETKS